MPYSRPAGPSDAGSKNETSTAGGGDGGGDGDDDDDDDGDGGDGDDDAIEYSPATPYNDDARCQSLCVNPYFGFNDTYNMCSDPLHEGILQVCCMNATN